MEFNHQVDLRVQCLDHVINERVKEERKQRTSGLATLFFSNPVESNIHSKSSCNFARSRANGSPGDLSRRPTMNAQKRESSKHFHGLDKVVLSILGAQHQFRQTAHMNSERKNGSVFTRHQQPPAPQSYLQLNMHDKVQLVMKDDVQWAKLQRSLREETSTWTSLGIQQVITTHIDARVKEMEIMRHAKAELQHSDSIEEADDGQAARVPSEAKNQLVESVRLFAMRATKRTSSDSPASLFKDDSTTSIPTTEPASSPGKPVGPILRKKHRGSLDTGMKDMQKWKGAKRCPHKRFTMASRKPNGLRRIEDSDNDDSTSKDSAEEAQESACGADSDENLEEPSASSEAVTWTLAPKRRGLGFGRRGSQTSRSPLQFIEDSKMKQVRRASIDSADVANSPAPLGSLAPLRRRLSLGDSSGD